MIEIDDRDACASWLALGEDRPRAALRALDLRDVRGFESGSFRGCLFLSCDLSPAQAGFLTMTGATVIREREDVRPYPAHRARQDFEVRIDGRVRLDDQRARRGRIDVAVVVGDFNAQREFIEGRSGRIVVSDEL